MDEINCKIPKIPDDPDPIELTVKNGFQLFVVGPNGSGKSALIQRFVTQNSGSRIKRITAHRQTWFESGSINLTPERRQRHESETLNYNTSSDARFKDSRAAQNLSAILFDLNDKEIDRARSIAHHVDNRDLMKAQEISAELPSPFDQINELLSLSTLTVTLENPEGRGRNLIAKHPHGNSFSIVEMSDGERSAMIIAADVITAEPETVFLIDEPERHLHRSIIQPFLSALFALRSEDCAFIVATHEIELPVANPDARVLMLRSCQWRDRECVAWDVQVLEPNSELPEDLKLAILGSRKIILFVEGKPSSKDFSLYTALFPSISVVPKGNCEEVQKAVFGLRESADLHRVKAFGLIDRDNRTDEEVNKLATGNIFALDVYSVEALYYCSDVIGAVAHRQADSLGDDANELINCAKQLAVDALKSDSDRTAERMASLRCERKMREQVLSEIPARKSIMDNPTSPICVSIDPIPYSEELKRFNNLVEGGELDQLVARYPLRKSRTFEIIATTLRCRDQKDYELMVCAQIKRDNTLAEKLKKRIEPLSKAVELIENPNPNN